MPADTSVLSHETLRAVCTYHRIPCPASVPVPWLGATSRVYPLGAAVLKVPHQSSDAIDALLRDVAVAPLARAAGVPTAQILAVDESRALLPLPYALLERIDGVALDRPRTARAGATWAWRELGRHLALVHTQIDAALVRPPLRTFVQTSDVDPRPWVDGLAGAGRLTIADARWLHAVLERLAPAALASGLMTLCHGDVNVANVIISGSPKRLSLIDWAGAGWLDPAWDFAGVPLMAVPAMLAGHREVAPLTGDATVEHRVLWCHLQVALDRLHRNPVTSPGRVPRLLRAARAFAAADALATCAGAAIVLDSTVSWA